MVWLGSSESPLSLFTLLKCFLLLSEGKSMGGPVLTAAFIIGINKHVSGK